MAKLIQREPEMQELKRELPFTSTPKDEANERTIVSIRDPDAMLIMIVLLLACFALALLADAVI
jgi:hypothetical protein